MKRYSEEHTVGFLGEGDASIPVSDRWRCDCFTEASDYSFRSECEGMSVSEAKGLEEMETESAPHSVFTHGTDAANYGMWRRSDSVRCDAVTAAT